MNPKQPQMVTMCSEHQTQTEALGERLGRQLRPGDVLCLSGPLGAGKTTLARGVARGWGSTVRVTSPTFTLVNEYPRPADGRVLYHLDCYRLGSSDEAETIGLGDILSGDEVVMIEWCERVGDWLPLDRLTILLAYRDDEAGGFTDRRTITITAGGPRSAALLAEAGT